MVSKSAMFERATRLCRMSPQIATTSRPLRRRIVSASKAAGLTYANIDAKLAADNAGRALLRAAEVNVSALSAAVDVEICRGPRLPNFVIIPPLKSEPSPANLRSAATLRQRLQVGWGRLDDGQRRA
jgi:hypothetical protein